MGEAGEFMLFGVRVVVDSLRKSVSLNNLSQYEHPQDNAFKPEEGIGTKDDLAPAAAGEYASADEAVHHNSSATRGERKRGVPWTEEEHKLFLLGLKRVGKGDWRGISRNFVKTRTPTQVASHAQKYFLRHTNLNRRRRRSSLFDITTDTVSAIPMEEEQTHDLDQNNTGSVSHPLPAPQPETGTVTNFSALPTFPVTSGPVVLPAPVQSKLENLLPGKGIDATSTSSNLIRSVPVLPACASSICDLNLDLNLTSTVEPLPLSLNLSLASDWRETSSRHLASQVMQGYNNGDSMISVA